MKDVTIPELQIDRDLYLNRGEKIPSHGKIERRIFFDLCAQLEAKGWKPVMADMDCDREKVSTAIEAAEFLFNLCDCRVLFSNGKAKHWILFVCGNGIDFISDYSYSATTKDGFDEIVHGINGEDYE